MIAKDENTVKLSTTTVTGNYTVDGKNVSDAGGPYVVIRTSELSLVGNSAGNYYIEKEDLSGLSLLWICTFTVFIWKTRPILATSNTMTARPKPPLRIS